MIRALNETKIPQIYSTGLYSENGYDLAQEHTHKILDVLVCGTTACLAEVKSKDFPVAFVYEEANKEFIAAAIVEYFPNEDDATKPGNWNYSWTFDKTDIPENARILTAYDNDMATFFRSVAHSKHSMGFDSVESMGDLFRYLLKTIVKWLDDNAAENEENGVSLDGVIQFRVAVENGEKVMSAEPDGEIKQLIKDDAAIEV